MSIKLIALFLSLVTLDDKRQAEIQNKNYELEDFDKIISHGGASLIINYSDRHSFQVNATTDCLKSVEISVSNRTLYIAMKDSKANTCKCTIDIGVPVLYELVQKGGGNVVLKEGFSPMNSFECKIEGGGNIDLSQLSVDSFYASIHGGGKMSLNARKELEGTISGGGLIEYSGNAIVRSYVSGGGTIRKQ